jgi:heat shock protein HslJ
MYTTKRSLLIAIALILLIACAYVLFASRTQAPQEGSDPASPDIEDDAAAGGTPNVASHTVTFVSEDGTSVTAVFSDDQVVLNGLGYTNATLPHAVSASGARYANSEGLELWNKGNDVTVSQDGSIIFAGTEASAADDQSLIGTWTWKELIHEGGEIHTPHNADAFTLTFDANGHVQGTTDCNGLSGTYTLENGMLTVGPVIQTRMYCEGSQEQEFVSALQLGSLAVSFQGTNTLVLLLPDNAGSLTLERQDS